MDFKARIKAFRIPVWYVPGNHDVGNKVNAGKGGAVTPARVADYEERMGRDWFSTNCAGVRVIGIDASILGSGLEPETNMWSFWNRKTVSAPSSMPTDPCSCTTHSSVMTWRKPAAFIGTWSPRHGARLYGLLKRGGVRIVLTGHFAPAFGRTTAMASSF